MPFAMQFWVSYQMNYLMCIALYQASEKMSKKYILEDVRFQKYVIGNFKNFYTYRDVT